jgi:hypothetical protein
MCQNCSLLLQSAIAPIFHWRDQPIWFYLNMITPSYDCVNWDQRLKIKKNIARKDRLRPFVT